MANWGNIGSRGSVDDRRSMAPALGGLSLTGVLLVVAFNFLTGGNVGDVLSQLETIPVEQQQNVDVKKFEGQDSYEVFASTVLGSNNDMWTKVFGQMNRSYEEPTLVLFRQATNSGCGGATSEVGPHYCSRDKTIYLDETFFDELTNRFGAKGGDVAEAYVIAHEVGHHVQEELGILGKVHSAEQSDPQNANELSVQLELQADCFAGLWSNSIRQLNVFDPGEIAEAMDAAAAVGDDRIQKKTTGRISPESWTHGSAEQRMASFDRGYESGSLASCNTFR
ncbi:MAG: neutral zinc metallopeptidase [bacterium]|nr:neutral zinc metallopeptidase [bacterium]